VHQKRCPGRSLFDALSNKPNLERLRSNSRALFLCPKEKPMLSIEDSSDMQRALSGPIDPDLKTILLDRLELLAEFLGDWDLADIADFYIVEPGDSLDVIEKTLGFSPLVNFVDGARYPDPTFEPSWEHLGYRQGWYDFVFALSDSGFGINLLVQDRDGIDTTLLELCQAYATR
jgi:hypothetical protein